MEENEFELIEEYAKLAVNNKGNWSDHQYVIIEGKAGYTRLDLLVINKIHNLLEDGDITREQYNYLIKLYNKYLELEDELIYLESKLRYKEINRFENETLIKERYEKTHEEYDVIYEELKQYELLPEFINSESKNISLLLTNKAQ